MKQANLTRLMDVLTRAIAVNEQIMRDANAVAARCREMIAKLEGQAQ